MKVKTRQEASRLSRRGFRVNPFAEATGQGVSTVWAKIKTGEIRSAKVGRSRIITESPEEFLARHEQHFEL